jgi:hypothetical protein
MAYEQDEDDLMDLEREEREALVRMQEQVAEQPQHEADE